MAVPDPPINGQFLYSKGLIEAAASAGIRLDVIALDRVDACPRRAVAGHEAPRWWVASDDARSRWASAISTLPHIANRTNTRMMRRLLREQLRSEEHDWEAIVFDSLSAGWALRPVLAHLRGRQRRPRLIYIAHNHEASLARRIADVHPHLLKRQVNRWDALKVARLERSLSRHADLITANSPEDCELFREDCPQARVESLQPVFLGTPVIARWIGPRVPRRAILLGSFDWLPKRLNLMEFMREADPLFAAAGVELQVVGGADRTFLDDLRKTATATTFTGPVDDLRPYLAEARMGIAAERIGGGFKLKTLDYVFNRVPLAALAGTIPGVPVVDGESAIISPDAATLARRVIETIDDFDALNRMQARAYRACSSVFDLPSVGQVLRSVDLRLAAPELPPEELAQVVIG